MTLEDFKTWRRSNDWLEVYAHEFFAYILKEYPHLLNASPARCYYAGVEVPSDYVLLIRYGVENCIYSMRTTDIEMFLQSPEEAAKKWAEETIEIQRKNKEKEERLKQKHFEEYQKDMTEYRRIKAKYGL
jgi:hypothetical protein